MNNRISALTKQQKLELLEAVKEKKRRSKLKKDVFIPHAGQRAVIVSKAMRKFVFCGNGWGKTATASNIAKWHAEGYNPITNEYTKVPVTVTIILDHPSKVESTWLPELRKWINITDDMLHKNGKPYYDEIRFSHASNIKFMFHEQPDMVYESTEFQVIICDEPIPRRIYIAISRGMRTKDREPKFYLFGTPIAQAWLRQDIYEPWLAGDLPSVECFRGNTKENEQNLRTGYMDEFGKFLTEEEKRIRFGGEFFDLGGLALAHIFNKEKTLITQEHFNQIFDKQRFPCVVAVDPHPSKAHVALLLGCGKDNQYYVIDSISEKLIARDFAKKIRQKWAGYRIMDYICDSLGSTDSTGGEGFKSFIDVCNEVLGRGRMRATTYKEKSDEDFIEKVREVLAVPDTKDNFGRNIPKLQIVAENNPELIKEIENASWKKDREKNVTDKLEISALDFLACLKYALAANLRYNRIFKQKATSYAKGAGYGFRRNR